MSRVPSNLFFNYLLIFVPNELIEFKKNEESNINKP